MLNVIVGNNVSMKSVIVNEEEAVIRTVLEENGIDSSRGMIQLNARPVVGEQLSMTFANFFSLAGINTDKCYLLNVAKADNAANVKVVGQAVVVTSSVKYDDLAMVETYKPEALTLTDEDGNQYFKVGTGSHGSVGKYGITFDSESRDDNKALVTLHLDYTGENVKEYLTDKLGGALINLKEVEKKIPLMLEEIKEERELIANSIEIVG